MLNSWLLLLLLPSLLIIFSLSVICPTEKTRLGSYHADSVFVNVKLPEIHKLVVATSMKIG